jgi:hypothetical protein
MPPVGFEPTISVGERPKTYALDGAATAGTGLIYVLSVIKYGLGGGHYTSCSHEKYF